MCLPLLAALRSGAWLSRVVLYVSDNRNVVTWLNKRQSKEPLIQALLRLFDIYGAKDGFSVVLTHIRTYRDTTADGLSRDNWEEVAESLVSQGFERMSGREARNDYLSILSEDRGGGHGTVAKA